MRVNSSITIGYFSLILWCVFSGVSRVDASALLKNINPFVMCFYIFLSALIFFCVLNINRISFLSKKTFSNFKEVFRLNLASFGCWFFIIYPLKYIEPSLVSAMNLGLSPVFAFIFQPFFYQNDKTNKQDRFFCLAFLLLFAYMLFIIFSDKTSVDVVSYFSMFISVVFIVLGSCFLSVSTIYAKRLSYLGFNPIETLAVRFFILVIFSGLIPLVDHQSLLLPSHQMTGVIKLSFLYAIIPLYFAQVSIRELQPVSLLLAGSISPLTVFMFQKISGDFELSYWTISALSIGFFLSIANIFSNYRLSFLKPSDQ